MRRVAVVALFVGFASAAAAPVHADETSLTPDTRDPISWFLDDLSALLNTAGDAVPKAEPPSVSDAPDPAPAPSPKVVDAAPAETPAPAFENPVSALFRDLAALFGGDREAALSSGTPIETPVADITPVQTVAEVEAAPTPSLPSDKRTSSVSWLLNDLFDLFGGNTKATAEVASASQDAPETDAATDKPVETVEAVPQSQNSADAVGVPWRQNRGVSAFDPDAPALTLDPNAPFETARILQIPVENTLPAANADRPADEQDVLRARNEPSPAVRNYASLGRNHKAVTPEPETGFFEKLFGALGFGQADLDVADNAPAPQPSPKPALEEPQAEILSNSVSDRVVPDERIDLTGVAPAIETNAPTIDALSEQAVLDIDLLMGEKIVIGTAFDTALLGSETCIERRVHSSVFCLTDMFWPAEIAMAFAMDTAFTLPGEGVVRYENGHLSRAYAVFAAHDFADVVKFMQRRFGPPTEREIQWMHMLEAPELPNTTFRWKAISEDRRDTIVLEVTNYDNLRRSFADLEHGMVRLYRKGSRPIFKHLSTMDLMLMQRRRVAASK